MRGRTPLVRIIFATLLAAALVPSGARADATTLRLPVELRQRMLSEDGPPDARRFRLPGGKFLRDSGQPALPSYPLEILIPRDAKVIAVRLAGGRELSLGRRAGLALAPDHTVPDGETVREATFSPEAILESRFYPPVDARLVSDQFEHGHHLVGVEVYPVRVDRENGELWLREEAELVVELAAGRDPGQVVQRQRRIEDWRAQTRAELARRLANPGALDQQPDVLGTVVVAADAPPPGKTPSLGTSPVRHLIITNESMRVEFQRLADYRTAAGLPSLVVTVDEILAAYRKGADLAETIRMYVADAYAKWGVDYLLLGGDSDVLPPRYVTSTFYPPGSSTEIPADLYFGALDGNWNADGDAVFGEPFVSGLVIGDFVDFAAEVAVGRAPVSTPTAAQVFVDKVLAYEQPADPTYQDRVLFASEVLFPASWQEGDAIQLDGALFSETIVDSMADCGSEFILTRLYENDAAYSGALPETKSEILAALDSGRFGVFHHIGHGFYFNMSVGDDNIVPADADALSNGPNFFLLYSLNCSSSAFDFDCLNERFLENPGGGSVVSIGSARAAFPNTANDYQNAFYRALVCDGRVRVGDAIVESRTQGLLDSFYNTSDRWTQFVYTLLGDPATVLWSTVPRVVEVNGPASLGLGENQALVTLVDAETSAPVEGVTVALSKDGEDYGTAVTDGNGIANLVFTPETVGAATLQVSGGGVLPVVRAVPVVEGGSGYPSVASLALDDDGAGPSDGNGNGRMEAGEWIEVTPLVRNGGSAPLVAATATLRIEDPFVVLIDSTVAVPALAANASALASDPFVLELDPATPDGHEIVLRVVTPMGSGGSWVDRETLVLAAPGIEVVDVAFDDSATGNGDGVVQAGEDVELVITLKNYGAGAVGGITGTLGSASPQVVVSDAAGTWGAMGGVLDTASNSGDRFTVRETDLAGEHEYELTLTDDQGRSIVHRFDLRAPQPVDGLALGFGGTGEVVLTWNPSSEADLMGYRVYRRLDGQSEFEAASEDIVVGSSYYRDAGLTPLSRFEYRVAAVDSGRLHGPPSLGILASTAPPEIDCFPLPLGLETSGDLAVGHLDADLIADMVIGADLVYSIDGDCREKVDGDRDAQTFGPISNVGGKYGPASIALGNLEPDGGLEIIASSWGTRELYVFDELGGILPGWPVQLVAQNWSTPAVGDLDGDGDLEIVVNDVSGYTYAFHHDGTEVADGDANPATLGVIVPRRSESGVFENFGRTSPALYDVDGDGQLEILFGSKFQNGRNETFWAWNADGSATNAPGWPKVFGPGSEFLASPTIADVDDDGIDEIIQLCENDSLYVWRPDGSRFAPFPIAKVSQAVNKDSLAPSVAVGDFSGDGKLEIVVVETLGGSKPSSRVSIVDWQGNTLAGWPKTVQNLSEASPVVGDIDGDGSLDVVFGVGGGADNQPNFLYAWSQAGEDVNGFPILLNGFVRSTPTICDLDGDGTVNVALASWDRLIHVWDMGAPYVEALVPWPTFRGNVHRNGVFGHRVPTSAPDPPSIPRRAELGPAIPNPFNPSTELSFVLRDGSSTVRLGIFDAQGRRVGLLAEGSYPAGEHSVQWDGRDAQGRPVASGVYHARLEVDGAVARTRKLVLVK